MLNKNEIIKLLKEINLPTNEYWLLAGSALVMYGIKERTNDIDLGCNNKLFNELIEKGYETKFMHNGCRGLDISNYIEVAEEWESGKIVLVDGFQVASLESIREGKLARGKEKDLRDVDLIDEYLKNKKEGR